jgi:hypothetical protein
VRALVKIIIADAPQNNTDFNEIIKKIGRALLDGQSNTFSK